MQIKDNIAPLIEDTKRDILEDIAETEADNSFGTFRFFFASPIDESYRFFEQQKLGLDTTIVFSRYADGGLSAISC